MIRLLDKQVVIGNIVALYQSVLGRKNGVSATDISPACPQNRTAHIFGSGASAIDTKTLLNKDSDTFGCNLTLALLPRWKAGFVERLQDDQYGRVQMEVLMNREFCELILKNNYPFRENKTKDNIQLLLKKHLKLSVLRECQILSQEEREHIEQILTYVLDEKTCFITQYASSILTMIIYAVRRGYTKIVLHGVDHGGACFYDYEPFKRYKLEDRKVDGILHQTDDYTVPFSAVLEQTVSRLANRGVVVKYAKELL